MPRFATFTLPLCAFSIVLCQKIPEVNAPGVSTRLPEAKCDFHVRENGPDGKLVTGVSLDTSLFYDITCKPSKGFCLRVSNCTVTGDEKGSVPYPIIDANGCTLEESLFGHVQYRTDFQAGIANPYPIRFRGASSAVIFYCQTTLEPKEGTKCEHFTCK